MKTVRESKRYLKRVGGYWCILTGLGGVSE